MVPNESISLRCSTCTIRPSDLFNLFAHHHSLYSYLDSVSIFFPYHETSQIPHWKKAMDIKISALVENDAWNFIRCPPNTSTIGNRWVYSIKL